MPLKSLFAYSFQSFYFAGSFLLLFIFLPSFYNLSVGFALSTVGMIILISRVFDVFSDFFIGYFTEKRFIKGLPKKNQILLGIFIFIFSIIGLYVIQPDNYYWFIFYYNLALISYSIAIIPYDSIVIDQKKIQHRRFYIAATKETQKDIDVIPKAQDGTILADMPDIYAVVPHKKGDHKVVYLRTQASTNLKNDDKKRTKGTVYQKK